MSTTRKQFEQTLSERKAINFQTYQDQANATFEEVVRTAWQERFPRRRKFSLKIAHKALGAEAYEALQKSQEAVVEALYQEYKGKTESLDSALTLLAENMTPESGEDWTKWSVSWSSTYSSQGYGSIRYAQNAAEMKADHARFHNLEVEVRKANARPAQGRYGIASADFEVWVKASPLDLEVLNRKPGPDLREQVRLAWKRGVNPRVYNPYLPHGYEEKVGLDYFGNDLKPTRGNDQ